MELEGKGRRIKGKRRDNGKDRRIQKLNRQRPARSIGFFGGGDRMAWCRAHFGTRKVQDIMRNR